MKKLLVIMSFILPIAVCSQHYQNISSPDYHIWMNVGIPGFSMGSATYPCIAFSPSGEPFIAYSDSWVNSKVTVKKFDGASWVNVGSPGFSADMANFISFVFSPTGEPYVTYSDAWYSSSLTIMKFDGTNWVYIGNAGFSSSFSYYTSLAFSPVGEPCVAFWDGGQDGKASVMKFDGSAWVMVGNAGFSTGKASFSSLAFSPSGEPFVAFADSSISNKATVMRFDGTNWVGVGNPGFSTGDAGWISLAFDSSGHPCVTFGGSYGSSQKATVMKFDGTNWANVGDPGFSAGYVNYTRLAFSPSGQPYVAYSDVATYPANKATVMKFDGIKWMPVGNEGFSAGEIGMISLAFNSSGQPYVAFTDVVNLWQATVMRYDSVFVGIGELKISQILVFPDPSTEEITIDLKDYSHKTNLAIFNIEGKELITKECSGKKTVIDITGLPKGIYFVKLIDERKIEVAKFIKK